MSHHPEFSDDAGLTAEKERETAKLLALLELMTPEEARMVFEAVGAAWVDEPTDTRIPGRLH
jgi:hypothetical protein